MRYLKSGSKKALELFTENREVIQNEDELRVFVDNQLKNREHEYLEVELRNRYDIDTWRFKSHITIIDTINHYCVFDPMPVLKEFEALNKVIEADIPESLTNGEEGKRKNMTFDFIKDDLALKMYKICLIDKAPTSEILEFFNQNSKEYDSPFRTKQDFEKQFIIKKSIFDRDPSVFDNEELATDLLFNFIGKQAGYNPPFESGIDKWKRNGIDVKCLDLINEMNDKLSIDMFKLLEDFQPIKQLFEKNYMKNQLANF